ncbi:MAG: Lrp/AsnC family transcriptional regulator, partial [Mesorhizobium sp.]
NFIDAEECQAVCDRLFDDDPHIVRYTTLFAVERYKEETAIPSDALAAKLAER